MTKILCVYINGSNESADFPKEGITSLANLLHQLTDRDEKRVSSICLDGCGIKNNDVRDIGGIFTWHLEKQINDLIKKIQTDYLKDGDKLILNVYGFSRGGAAAFLICKKLSHISAKQLEINVLSFEPVPGNFITPVYADRILGINSTLASIVADLRDCKNIKRMQVLFTQQPLPDIACHGPLLPAMPLCEMSVDVVPGCHRGSEIFRIFYDSVSPENDESAIAFHQAVNFLQQSGTPFDFSNFKLSESLKIGDKKILNELYSRQLAKVEPSTRYMHFGNMIYAQPQKEKYLNCHHQSISGESVIDPEKCALRVKDRKPIPSYKNGQKSAISIIVPALLFSAAAILYRKFSNPVGTAADTAISGISNSI